MSDKIIYEPHPVSQKRKEALRSQGYRILDARFDTNPKKAEPKKEEPKKTQATKRPARKPATTTETHDDF